MKQRVHLGHFGTIEKKKLYFMYRTLFKYIIDGKCMNLVCQIKYSCSSKKVSRINLSMPTKKS